MVIAFIVVSSLLFAALVALFAFVAIKRARVKADKNDYETIEGVERFSFKKWFARRKPSKRRLIQLYAALLYNANIKGFITGNIYTGNTKFVCVPGLNCYSCPGAVGACPLGALQNALRETNRRAPFYMLGTLALFGLALARTVCGFLCPVGLVQELLYKIRTPKLTKSKATRALSCFKYVLLAVLVVAIPVIYGLRDMTLPAFCKYICPAGTLGGAVALLIHPSNSSVFDMLGPAFTWKFCLLVALCAASVFVYRLFCRFLCPLGALYGFFNRLALLGIKLDGGKCTDCGLCIQHCKMDVKKVGDRECINCGECISVCPAKAISWKGAAIFVRGTVDSSPAEEKAPPLASFIKESDSQEVKSCAAQTRCETENAAEVATARARKKLGKRFWAELAAWAVALVVLTTALVCYNVNFTDRENTPPDDKVDVATGNKIGDLCPDFTLDLYQGGGQYNLYQNRGKLTLINFWYIGCGGCEEEMPYIGELSLSEEYDVEIIVIHGLYSMSKEVDNYLVEHGWSDYDIKFAQDKHEGNTYLTYKALGGKGFWPMTVILDGDGIVRYNSTTEFKSFEQLKEVINSLANGN